MGKRAARNKYTSKTANAQKVHVNDPSRRKAARHNSVKKATRARLAQRAANLDKATSKPTAVDEFGNPLYPNNDGFFDGGSDAQ